MFVKKENMNITLKLRSVGCINTIIQLDYNFIQSIILNYGDNCTLITVFKKASPRRRLGDGRSSAASTSGKATLLGVVLLIGV